MSAADVDAARERVRQAEELCVELAKPLPLSCDVRDVIAALYSRRALQEAATKTLATMRARLAEAEAAARGER